MCRWDLMQGKNNQGECSIAIGSIAGMINQSKNSIIINASDKELNGSSQGLYINPIRKINYYNPLNYNPVTKEVTVLSQENIIKTEDIEINSESIYKLKGKKIITKENNQIEYLIEDVMKINKEFVNCFNGVGINVNYNAIIIGLIEEVRKLKEKVFVEK